MSQSWPLSVTYMYDIYAPIWIPQQLWRRPKAASILVDGEIGGSIYGTIYPTISGSKNNLKLMILPSQY